MLSLKKHDQGFAIYYDNYIICEHHYLKPLAKLGAGTAKYNMRHGSFKIRDKISKLIYLQNYDLVEEAADKLVISFENVLTLVFSVVKEGLEITPICKDKGINRFWFNIKSDISEHIYGCGEQYSRLNLKGKRVPIWCEEQGIGRGKDLLTFLAELTHGAGGNAFTTYYPQPSFITSNNMFCYVDTTDYMEFDFSVGNINKLFCFTIPSKIIIAKKASAVELIKGMTDLLGRQPVIPEWCYSGVLLGVQGGVEVLDKKLQNALRAGVEVAAVWAQDWEGIRITSFGKQLMWDWRFDDKLYSELPKYIEKLNKEKNIRFLGYINPFLALEGELYKEASRKGYLIRNKDGNEYHVKITTFPAAMLDLSNPEAVIWIKRVIRENLLGIGLSGWMADFGEYMPVDAVLYSGENAEGFHNKYPVLWAKVNYEALEEENKLGDAMFFTRAGYSGTNRYSPIVWAGDQLVNYSKDDGLPTVIPAGISLGLSGVGIYHSDIGGYTTVAWLKRKKELFMRWTEHAALTIIMRTHEGNRPDVNWQFDSDEETLKHFVLMSKVHKYMNTYFKMILQEYYTHGLPVMRHPYIHYENDSVLHKLKYEYLLGRDILAAPVIKPGRRSWRVYLPEDAWIHIWTGREYNKGWHRIAAPLGQPPIFYRKASDYAELFGEIKSLK